VFLGNIADGLKREILVPYPAMTGDLLRKIYRWYAPRTPNKADTVLAMIGSYYQSHRKTDQPSAPPLPEMTPEETQAIRDEMFAPLPKPVTVGGES
jgi:hypothetical protein